MIAPDHVRKAHEALVTCSAAMVRNDPLRAVDAICTANHHLGAAIHDGTPLQEYADLCALVVAHQTEVHAYLALLLTPARGGA